MLRANSWPFDQPRDCAVLTTREVIESGEPILRVIHDSDDHGWQFIGSSDGTWENSRMIALDEAVALDSSLLQLADLPIGWRAVRDSVDDEWRREAIDEA